MSAKKKTSQPGRPKTGVTKEKPSLSIDKALMRLARKQASKQRASVSSLIESYIRDGIEAAKARKGAAL